LGLLSLGVVAFLGLIWASLKVVEMSGNQAAPPAWTHPLAQLKTWDLRRPENCDSSDTLISQIQSSPKDAVWFIDVQPQKDQWIFFCNFSSSTKLYQQWQQGPDLAPVLTNLTKDQDHFYIFNIHASQDEEAKSFLRATSEVSTSQKIAAISPSRIPIRTIRKERPQWFFGADGTSWTKVVVFHSLGLVGFSDLWADFYILGRREQDALNNANSLVEFLNHKNKTLIMESGSKKNLVSPYKGVLIMKD